MGLSSYSNPADAGMLCVILVNTAISISMMKEIVCSILHVIMGIHATSSSSSSSSSTSSNQIFADSFERRDCPAEAYMEEFRSQTTSFRYIPTCHTTKQECSVCLMEFRTDAEMNQLSCGHVFHKSCVEKWLKCWKFTCPLCRNQMMVPKEIEENTCPM